MERNIEIKYLTKNEKGFSLEDIKTTGNYFFYNEKQEKIVITIGEFGENGNKTYALYIGSIKNGQNVKYFEIKNIKYSIKKVQEEIKKILKKYNIEIKRTDFSIEMNDKKSQLKNALNLMQLQFNKNINNSEKKELIENENSLNLKIIKTIEIFLNLKKYNKENLNILIDKMKIIFGKEILLENQKEINEKFENYTMLELNNVKLKQEELIFTFFHDYYTKYFEFKIIIKINSVIPDTVFYESKKRINNFLQVINNFEIKKIDKNNNTKFDKENIFELITNNLSIQNLENVLSNNLKNITFLNCKFKLKDLLKDRGKIEIIEIIPSTD